MIDWFSSLSVWAQSILVGLSFIPIIFLVTAVILFVFDTLIDPLQQSYFRYFLRFVAVATYGVILFVPILLHIHVLQPEFRSENSGQLALPWLVLWGAVSVAPIWIYSLLESSNVNRLRWALHVGAIMSLGGMGLATLLLLPIYLLHNIPKVEIDLDVLRIIFFATPYLGFLVLFNAALALNTGATKGFDGQGNAVREVRRERLLFASVAVGSYILTLAIFTL